MILVNSPGSQEDAYAPLVHAKWNGWTFADTVFPFFMWIVGVSLMLSSALRVEHGEDRGSLLRHAVRRSALLFCCGVVLDALIFPVRVFPYFTFQHYVKLTGVLQTIAVCYLVAIVIFLWIKWRGVIVWIFSMNLIYLGLMFFYPVPGCGAGAWTMDCNFARYVDEIVHDGHIRGWTELSGLISILPAITTVLLGVLAGYVLQQELIPRQRALRLLAMACGLIPSGFVMAIWVPLNKTLWTSSYVFLMSGLASLCLAFWYWVADIQQRGHWLKPMEIYGMNAIAAYIVYGLSFNLPRVHFFGKSLYADVCLAIASPANASLLYAAAHVLGIYLVVWWMYRRRRFLRF
jgi:predicted acyltransferase